MKHLRFLMLVIILLFLVFIMFLINGFYQNRRLFSAIEINDYDAVKSSISRGAFINLRFYPVDLPIFARNPTPLIEACKIGNLDVIELLIKSGAKINETDNITGQTPLRAAFEGTKQNRYSLALFLINNGADFHAVSDIFQKSIYISEKDNEGIHKESLEFVKFLLSNNVDTTIRLSRETPLSYAVKYRNYYVVEYFIKDQIYDVNEVNGNDQTPLMVAVQSSQANMVKLLLNHGADKTIVCDDGKTALDYAIESGNEEIIALLSN